MTPLVKIPHSVLCMALDDLERPHPFALERLGFLSFRQSLKHEHPHLLCYEYHPIPDWQYIEDPSFGGRIGGEAIQDAMGRSFRTSAGQLWVHMHARHGRPATSITDRREGPRVIQSCANAQPRSLHGWAVISEDGISGEVRDIEGRRHALESMSVIGWPLMIPWRSPTHKQVSALMKRRTNDRYSRQSFLGHDSQRIIERAKVGVVGLGGGGSHIVQQLAHIGFQRVVFCDAQRIDSTNINRLVGATLQDVRRKRFKAEIAARVFKGLQPNAVVDAEPKCWEEKRSELRNCDVIFGAVDGFGARRDLEAFCRANLIPYIDIGMAVLRLEGASNEVRGQVILSMPGGLCMHCLQFLTPENLGLEAQLYDADPQPQVVWPNGVLASTAVGYWMNLVTGWSGSSIPSCRVDYRGSKGTLVPSNIAAALSSQTCPHYPLSQCGDPVFKEL